jgi:outer membrane protein TolC
LAVVADAWVAFAAKYPVFPLLNLAICAVAVVLPPAQGWAQDALSATPAEVTAAATAPAPVPGQTATAADQPPVPGQPATPAQADQPSPGQTATPPLADQGVPGQSASAAQTEPPPAPDLTATSAQADQPAPGASATVAEQPPAPPDPKLQVLTLHDALRLAFTQGRDIQTQEEELRLTEMALHTTRLDYGPRPTATLSTQRTGPNYQNSTLNNTANVGVTQQLPTGGSLNVTSNSGLSTAPGIGSTKTQTESATLTQPLLANAGYLIWRQGLTNAEEALLYAQRADVIFRQNLAISIASTFWGLQGQKNSVDQAVEQVDRATFLLEQSRALMQIGKSNADDVFRAETGQLQARQDQIDAEAAYQAALDNFRTVLALPDDVHIALVKDLPKGLRLVIDPKQVIAEALKNRLDLRTAYDQVRDAARNVEIARRTMLPELDANAGITYGGSSQVGWDQAAHGPTVYTAGLTLTIPIAQYDNELNYQRALITRIQAQRGYDLQRQQLIVQVLNTLNSLRQSESSLMVQARTRVQTRMRAEKANLDFNAGLIPNRDLLEAQQDVQTSENAWFSALVQYRTNELQLRQETGDLVVGPDGAWSEDVPPYAQQIPDAPETKEGYQP